MDVALKNAEALLAERAKDAERTQIDMMHRLGDLECASGAHVHDVSSTTETGLGGLHQHVFHLGGTTIVGLAGGERVTLPAGAMLVTNSDGPHAHQIVDGAAAPAGSGHRHVVALGDGVELITETAGLHPHALAGARTVMDGEHTHTLRFGPTVLTSLARSALRALSEAVHPGVVVGLGKQDDDLPTVGLAVSPMAMAEAILSGEKTLLVKSRPLDIGEARYVLLNGRRALGVVELGTVAELSDEQFAAREDEHRITQAIRAEWCGAQPSWCAAPLYAWPVKVVAAFPEPLETNVPTGPQVVVRDVQVFMAESGSFPTLRVPNPRFLLERARQGLPVGVLSSTAMRGRTGVQQALVNELEPLGFSDSFVWAVATLGDAERVASVEALGGRAAHVAEQTKAYFAKAESLFYIPATVVRSFSPPLQLRAAPAGRAQGAHVDLAADVVREARKAAFLDPAVCSLAQSGDIEELGAAVITSRGLVPVMVWQAEPPRGELPALKVPDPKHFIARLRAGQTAGLLSRRRRTTRVGQPQALVNEVAPADFDGAYVWAVVAQDDPVQIDSMAQLTAEQRAGVDEFSAREFATEQSIWYLPLNLVVLFEPPLRLKQPPGGRRFGATVDFDRDVEKSRQLTIDDALRDRTLKAIQEFVADPSPEALATEPDGQLISMDRELHRLFARAFPPRTTRAEGVTREDVVNAHIMLLRELERRNVQTVEVDPLAEETTALLRRGMSKGDVDGDGQFAPIYPGGAAVHADDPVALTEVLGALSKPMALRMPAVYLVGSVCNAGKSENDIDLLIRGPFDADTEHVIKFRLGRALGPRLSQRVQFHTEGQGGPYTNHVALYDLVLVPHEDRTVKEMALTAKQDDPLQDWPDAPGKRPAVMQFHFRGKTLHADLRMQVKDFLVGWTMALQKAGAVPEVNTVAEARVIADAFDVAGSRYTKPMMLPDRIFAAAKSRQPTVWLDLGDVVVEPGGVGATRNEPGVYVEVATPQAEWGLQKPFSHEYFLTGDPKFSGTLTFRMLEGGDQPMEEGVAQEGETFWTGGFNKVLLPGVLRRHSVDNETMPPLGQSGMPTTLMQATPREYRFWLADSEAEARRIRDALVDARFFTEENVVLDGEFQYRRSERKVLREGYDPEEEETEPVAKQERVPFALLWQWWKGQTVVRAAPSRQVWHLVLGKPDGSGVWDFQLQRDPLSGEEVIAGVRQEAGNALLNFEGDVAPGTRVAGLALNDTKNTASGIQRIDSGRADLLDAQRAFLKFRLGGQRLKGLFTLVAEEVDSDLFQFSPGSDPRRAIPKQTEAQGHSHRLPGGGVTTTERGGQAHVHGLADAGRTGGPALRGNTHVHALANGTVSSTPVEPAEKRFRVQSDGTQVWDPADIDDTDDKGGDRTLLRPPALFQPMKPAKRETSTFTDADLAARTVFTDQLVRDGVQVEPKYNGFRAVAESWDAGVAPGVEDGGVLVFTEDRKRDLSSVLPGLTADLRKVGGNFILDGEIMGVDAKGNFLPRRELARFRGTGPADDSALRFVVFDALYLSPQGNLTAVPLAQRRRLLERWWAGQKLGERFILAPRRMAKTRSQLVRSMEWAKAQPGSEGALLKQFGSTYSLGGENDLWAKVKLTRELRALVVGRHEVKGSPGVYDFVGAVGPIPAGDAAGWAEPVEHDGKTYVTVGRTGNKKLDANVGDTILVQLLELLWEDGPPRRVRWFGPAEALEIIPGAAPSSTEDVRGLLRPGELVRGGEPVAKLHKLERAVRLLKAESPETEERYVFGVVLVPDEVDAQGDVYSAKEVEKAAHSFLEHFGGKVKVMHKGKPVEGVIPIESYLSKRVEEHGGESFPVGTWFLATRVKNDDVWAAVKAGAFTGYSMGGTALREALGPEAP
jgi:hypothetical protein